MAGDSAPQTGSGNVQADDSTTAVITLKDHPRDFEQFIAVLRCAAGGPTLLDMAVTVGEAGQEPLESRVGDQSSLNEPRKIVCRIEEGSQAGKLLYIEISKPASDDHGSAASMQSPGDEAGGTTGFLVPVGGTPGSG